MSNNTLYLFEKPLQEGILLKRNRQFTMDVLLDGVTVKCHCPTTGRIGDVDTKNINRNDGVIDSATLRLQEVLGMK